MQVQDLPLHKLLRRGEKRYHGKGEVVQDPASADCFMLVTKGFVKRCMANGNGVVSIHDVYGPGYFFPMTMMYGVLLGLQIYEGPETYYHETMTDVELYSLKTSELNKATRANPMLYRDLLLVSGRRLRAYIHRSESLSLGSVYRRVAHLIYYLANEFGENNLMLGTELALPLTHADIASILGVARETVSRGLARLQKEGLVMVNGGSVTVPDTIKLETAAYGAAARAD